MMKNSVDFSNNHTPEVFVTQMFEKTSAQDELYLYNWYDVDCDDCCTYNDFSVGIHWTNNDVNVLIADYNRLFEELKIIAENYEEFMKNPDSATLILSDQKVITTYFTYIVPFLSQTREERKEEAASRVGESLCGYEMIVHAMRLCRLLSLKAPELVIHNEARHLIACMAIHYFAHSQERIIGDSVPNEISLLRSAWASLLYHAEQGVPFRLAYFKETYQQTLQLLTPYTTQTDVPKNLLPIVLFAHNFGNCPVSVDDKTQKAAQRLTLELLGYFSYTQTPFEEGKTMGKNRELISLPFHIFDEALEICKTLL